MPIMMREAVSLGIAWARRGLLVANTTTTTTTTTTTSTTTAAPASTALPAPSATTSTVPPTTLVASSTLPPYLNYTSNACYKVFNFGVHIEDYATIPVFAMVSGFCLAVGLCFIAWHVSRNYNYILNGQISKALRPAYITVLKAMLVVFVVLVVLDIFLPKVGTMTEVVFVAVEASATCFSFWVIFFTFMKGDDSSTVRYTYILSLSVTLVVMSMDLAIGFFGCHGMSGSVLPNGSGSGSVDCQSWIVLLDSGRCAPYVDTHCSAGFVMRLVEVILVLVFLVSAFSLSYFKCGKLHARPSVRPVTLVLGLYYCFVVLSYIFYVFGTTGYCIFSISKLVFAIGYGPALYWTARWDSALLRSTWSAFDEKSPLLSKSTVEDLRGRIGAHGQVEMINSSTLQMEQLVGIGSNGEVYRARWRGSQVAVKKLTRLSGIQPWDSSVTGSRSASGCSINHSAPSGDEPEQSRTSSLFRLAQQGPSTDSTLQTFLKEVQVMSKLRHPNICAIMGCVCEDTMVAIVTEYFDRGSLFDLIHREHVTFRMMEIVRVGIEVAQGLNYLHGCDPPIIHRDLKSGNVLMDSQNNIKICDFGFSRPKVDATMSLVGTVQWMAPELMREEKYTEKVDVYSYGVLLWELVTSEIPFGGISQSAVWYAVAVEGKTLELPDEAQERFGREFCALLSSCLEVDPSQRPLMSEVLTEMGAIRSQHLADAFFTGR